MLFQYAITIKVLDKERKCSVPVLKTEYIFHHFTKSVNDIHKSIKGEISHSTIFCFAFQRK